MDREELEAGGARVLVEQTCKWGFGFVKGTFVAQIWMDEGPDGVIRGFALKESSFMKAFRGGWVLEEREGGGTLATHHYSIAPSMAPPPFKALRGLVVRSMQQQERRLLADVAVELMRRGAGTARRARAQTVAAVRPAVCPRERLLSHPLALGWAEDAAGEAVAAA